MHVLCFYIGAFWQGGMEWAGLCGDLMNLHAGGSEFQLNR